VGGDPFFAFWAFHARLHFQWNPRPKHVLAARKSCHLRIFTKTRTKKMAIITIANPAESKSHMKDMPRTWNRRNTERNKCKKAKIG
jgi:hypothetical protein